MKHITDPNKPNRSSQKTWRVMKVNGEELKILGSNRPLKKCSSNAPGSWISKKRVVQTRLRSECEGHFGLFAGRFARFGRTYPMAHA
ncbi:hypothetical protein [Diaphorobacter sp. LR2014-1]|uniref:hypothetical protein n=1 Tax=Diaphorobacter sp. LR2014-1 TaxID=1933219 RepID=UPI0011AF882F|nr:hypothetical protein [Diaphorobacter sp. LR2014-1]